jgi:hypothetical protein
MPQPSGMQVSENLVRAVVDVACWDTPRAPTVHTPNEIQFRYVGVSTIYLFFHNQFMMVLRLRASLLVLAALTQLAQLSEALLSAPLAQQKCVYSSSSAFTQVDRVRLQRSVGTQSAVRHAHTSPVMVFDFFKQRASEGIKRLNMSVNKMQSACVCSCCLHAQHLIAAGLDL